MLLAPDCCGTAAELLAGAFGATADSASAAAGEEPFEPALGAGVVSLNLAVEPALPVGLVCGLLVPAGLVPAASFGPADVWTLLLEWASDPVKVNEVIIC